MYKWKFGAEVKNILTVPVQITEFGFYFFEGGEWQLRNFGGSKLDCEVFSARYAEGDPVEDGWLQPGQTAVNEDHWTVNYLPMVPRGKWSYTAEDEDGNIYIADAEIEFMPYKHEPAEWSEEEEKYLVSVSGVLKIQRVNLQNKLWFNFMIFFNLIR